MRINDTARILSLHILVIWSHLPAVDTSPILFKVTMGETTKKIDFAIILAKGPNLTDAGLSGEPDSINRSLLSSEGGFEQFKLCVEWLGMCPKRKTVNKDIGSSYQLKRRIEKLCGCCISNGVVIAAVLQINQKVTIQLGAGSGKAQFQYPDDIFKCRCSNQSLQDADAFFLMMV